MLYIYLYYELVHCSRNVPSGTLIPLYLNPQNPKEERPLGGLGSFSGAFRVKKVSPILSICHLPDMDGVREVTLSEGCGSLPSL